MKGRVRVALGVCLAVVAAAASSACVAGSDAPLFTLDAGAVTADGAVIADADPPTDAGPPFVGVDAGPPPADLDGFIRWQMAAGGLPGIAAAIVTRDGIEWSGTYGLADVETSTPVDDATLFLVASVSKPVSAVALMQLVEQGRIDLDAPASSYTGFPIVHATSPAAVITTRMLLTHTSGIEDAWLVLGHTSATTDPTITLREFAEGYVTDGGAFYSIDNFGGAPATRWSYTNAGFGIGAFVAESVSSERVADLVRANVLVPLGMSTSGYFLSELDAAHVSTGYTYSRGRGLIAYPHQSWAFYPAAMLRTSLHDLSRFARAMLRDGELDGARVLMPETVTEIRRRQVPGLRRSQALVWSYDAIGAHEYLAHSGAALEGSAIVAMSWDSGKGIVLMSNCDAYVRARAGLTEGRVAFEAIADRLDAEASAP